MTDIAAGTDVDEQLRRADVRNGEAPGRDDGEPIPPIQPVDPDRWAERAVRELRGRRWRASVAESLTSGMVAATLGRARGSGRVFDGGVVTYSRAAKSDVLGIDACHVVDADTAEEMAVRARALFGSDVAVSLTGVAGPERQDDAEVGTVFVGWSTASGQGAERHRFAGEPEAVCRQAACVALRRLHHLAAAAR